MSVTLAQIASQSLKIIIGVAPYFEGTDSCASLRFHLAKTREIEAGKPHENFIEVANRHRLLYLFVLISFDACVWCH
jgi:hypothetical protein